MRHAKIIGLFLLFVLSLELLTAGEKNKSDFLKRTGFIFNTDNILFDVEGYQGGVGFKYRGDKLVYRVMTDFSFSSSTNKLTAGTGLAIEKHLRDGKISPYWGWFLNAAYESEKFESDSENWNKLIQYPLSTGGLLGVEVFLMDFLSFFAEYNLSFELTGVTNQQSVSGNVTEDTTWNYNISTGIGNNSKLGIIIYLDDVVTLKKKAE